MTAGLCGVWELISVFSELEPDGERVPYYAPDPSGTLVLTPDGWMVAMITSGNRVSLLGDEAALFRSMMSYSGRYRLEGEDRFVTTVDLAWEPTWVGTEQVRFFKLAGDRLSITSVVQTHPLYPGRLGRGVLEWRRARD